MDDLISRQAAIDTAIEAVDDWDGGFSKERDRFIRDAFEELPPADAELVKHGCLEWRKEKTVWQAGYYCSECQAFFGKDYDMVQYFNYCPNCGAKLEGAEE